MAEDRNPIHEAERSVIAAALRFDQVGGYCDYDNEAVEAQRILLNRVGELIRVRGGDMAEYLNERDYEIWPSHKVPPLIPTLRS